MSDKPTIPKSVQFSSFGNQNSHGYFDG